MAVVRIEFEATEARIATELSKSLQRTINYKRMTRVGTFKPLSQATALNGTHEVLALIIRGS